MAFVFADFRLDLQTRQLLRRGAERHVEPKALDLLALLLSRRPDAVSKGEIQQRLWPGTFVTESSVTGLMSQIRQALGDDPRAPRFVRTVHGFGYAFCGMAAEDRAAAPASEGSMRSRSRLWAQVLWKDKVFSLSEGVNVLGRDEAATVCLDWPGVSRQHARIVVASDGVTIEDLGSKNGTYLREKRITQVTPLVGGDRVRLGRLEIEFRLRKTAFTTRTELAD